MRSKEEILADKNELGFYNITEEEEDYYLYKIKDAEMIEAVNESYRSFEKSIPLKIKLKFGLSRFFHIKTRLDKRIYKLFDELELD